MFARAPGPAHESAQYASWTSRTSSGTRSGFGGGASNTNRFLPTLTGPTSTESSSGWCLRISFTEGAVTRGNRTLVQFVVGSRPHVDELPF